MSQKWHFAYKHLYHSFRHISLNRVNHLGIIGCTAVIYRVQPRQKPLKALQGESSHHKRLYAKCSFCDTSADCVQGRRKDLP
jgi:hypothetical protein